MAKIKAFVKIANKAGKNIPKLITYVKPIAGTMKAHILEIGLGAGIVGLGADDLHQRKMRKIEQQQHETHERNAAEAIKKQDGEIQVLKQKAEKVDDLEAMNDVLMEVVHELKEGEMPDEQKETVDLNRTAD